MASNQSKFDFDAYNATIKDANTGLKLFLGLQLIQNVVSSLEHFDNPLEAELRPIYVSLKQFRETYKKHAEELAAKRDNPSERNASLDNANLPQVGVQQMIQMFEQMQRMIAATKAGNDQVAATAAASITEIQNGETLQPAADLKDGTNG